MRGSDPDAALYWLVRLLDGWGGSPLRGASFDPNGQRGHRAADPRALRMALDASEVYERLGSPEGELALAQSAVYLAMAPKSNAAYQGL